MNHKDYIHTGFDIFRDSTGNSHLDTFLNEVNKYVLELESVVGNNFYKCLDDCGWVGTLDEAELWLDEPHCGEHGCPDCGRPVCNYFYRPEQDYVALPEGINTFEQFKTWINSLENT